MTERKRNSRTTSAEFDAHVVDAKEYEDIPELTDAWFEKADLRVGGKLVRRGRPPSETRKKAVSIRLSQDVLSHFRASGGGWQTRIDEALRDWIKRTA